LCRSRKNLVETWVQVLGQLRANLELAFPGAIGLFTKPGVPAAVPTADKAAWRSPRRLATRRASAGYASSASAEILHYRPAAAAPGLPGREGDPAGRVTIILSHQVAQ
jgi:hypothetical protein